MGIAFIGLGANLGNPLTQCQTALQKIGQLPATTLKAVSSFYKTEPLSPSDAKTPAPWYVNAVCQISTLLLPRELLGLLLEIERSMGRERSKKWESRLIDLDLLFYDNIIMNQQGLILPHPQIPNRRFILTPLAEIAPDWPHPVFYESIAALAQKTKDPLKVERIKL